MAVFLFVITIAAAEAAVGLALFIKIFNEKQDECIKVVLKA